MGLLKNVLDWLQRRNEVDRLAQADAHVLAQAYGDMAYRVARRFERDVTSTDGTVHEGRTADHWRRVAALIPNSGRKSPFP